MKNLKNIFIIIILLFIIIFFGFVFVNKLAQEKETEMVAKHQFPPLIHSNYNWEKLSQTSGRKNYEDDSWESVSGIDVSHYQGEIDWKSVKNDGIEFVIIRAGYRGYGSGKIVEDTMFKTNISSAVDAGLDVGVYFFSQAISVREAKKEARFVADLVEDYEVKYPIVFDMEYVTEEDRIRKLSIKNKTEVAQAFCEEVENLGYAPMIYGSSSWLQNAIFLEQLGQFSLWVADYSEIPDFPYSFKMWQYTSEGTVSGIESGVDINLWFRQK